MLRRLQSLTLIWALLVPALAHGPLHERIQQLTAALEQSPSDAALLEERGELFRLHGLFSEARLDWSKVATLRPDDVTNHLRLGLVALGMGETNDAINRLEQFVSARPSSITGQLTLAEALVAAGRPADAVPHWTSAIRLTEEPRPEWFLDRARAARSGGIDVDLVLAGLDDGIDRHGPLPALQLLAVELETGRGNTDAALRRIAAIADRAERKERWLLRRGDILLAAGRTNEARMEFQAARKALDQLPDKVRRGWAATELRQQIDTRLSAP